jgi:capsular exopolysaccharide synthesis family protein
MSNKKFSQEDMDDPPPVARRIPSIATLFHIFWLKKWPILIAWMLFGLPVGVLLSIFDIPVSYSATTVLRFPNVVGAQTNVMRDIAITQRESILGIINSWQVMEGTTKKLSLRFRITSKDIFRKTVFRSISYTDELGLGVYILDVEKDSRKATLFYRPKEAKAEYALFSGQIGADNHITTNGLELVLQESLVKGGKGIHVEMEMKPTEETIEDLRDAMVVRSLGTVNLEIKLKDSDPYFVAEILDALRIQFLEVYYGTTEVQDVGILVQMEKDLEISKKKLEVSQGELSDYYAEHPELTRNQNTPQSEDNLAFLESRQESERTERIVRQIRSVAQAKPVGGSDDEQFYWAAEMIQTMVQAEEPRASILRGTMAALTAKQNSYRNTLGPDHPKVLALSTEKDSLYRQIDDTQIALLNRLEKDLSQSRIRMARSAPVRAAQVPVKLQLEAERLAQVNTQSQQIYDRLLESYNRAKLVTGSEFFKVTVVDPARPAMYKPPSFQTRLLIAALAVAVLSLAIPALLLLWNIIFLKVWIKDDLSQLLGMKPLGVIAFNPYATGTTKPKEEKKSQRKGKAKGKTKAKNREDEVEQVADINAPKPTRPPDPLLLFYGSAYRIEDLEAYRIIREEAENFFRNERPGKYCLMVTSTQPNEGKTMITSNLAMTFARKGKRTLLIDADFRLGRVDKVFNMPGATGLDELLSQTDMTDAQFMETVTLCFQPTMQRNLIVVPRKKFNPNAGEIVSSDRFKAFIRMAREQFDVVLIDTPPVMITPEPLSLAEVTDGVIYVCRSGNTSVSDSLEAVGVLEERGVRVAAVLNGVKGSPFIQNRYSKYSYYYGQPGADESSS